MAKIWLYFQTPRSPAPVAEFLEGDLPTALLEAERAPERGLRFLGAWFPEDNTSLIPCQACQGCGCLACDHAGYLVWPGKAPFLHILTPSEGEP